VEASLRALRALVLALLLAPGLRAEEDRFQEAAAGFARALGAATEPGLASIEAWAPGSPVGALDDLVHRVSALPLTGDHVPRLVRLVASDDPFRQEAGLRLVRAAAAQGLAEGAARAADAAAARAIDAPDVDPWVVLAAVELVESADEGPLEALLAALARAAARGPTQVDGEGGRAGPSRSRMHSIAGEAWARLDRALGASLGKAGKAEAAVLARLEVRHGTKGPEATRAAVQADEALRRAYLALAEGDRKAAAWALDQARAADAAAGNVRAADVKRLAALLGD
jgi:hypothetical protein